MKLDYKTYLDNVLACWTGKSLGGIVGAPYECHKRFTPVDVKNLWPKILFPNDDLDIQVVFLEALQEHGLFIDSEILAKYWQKHCFYVCCEYGVFIDNMEHGILPPLSGTWNNDWFHDSMGCPIRAEIWGVLCPGNPALATEYAAMDGCLDHSATSVEIEKFWAAAASMSFFEKNLYKLLDKSIEYTAKDAVVREIYADVKATCKQYPELRDAWTQVVRHWGSRNATYAKTNTAITLLALFLGGNDFKRTMHNCIQCGWDADCTAATAGALLGLLNGTAGLPADWCRKMGKNLVCACEIPHQHASLKSFAEETCLLGAEMAKVRNTGLTLTGAPALKRISKAPAPCVKMTALYPDKPVLWRNKTTEVQLVIENGMKNAIDASLAITAPADVKVAAPKNVKVAAGKSTAVHVAVSMKAGVEWRRSKNLFKAVLKGKGGKAIAEREFGLQGARCYTVYGPYWDMWDKAAYPICPYANDEFTCNPGNIPGLRDAMDAYVNLDTPYLDEARLVKGDIPEERPYIVEIGGDFIYRDDLSHYKGTSCYYLVRTIRSEKEIPDVNFCVGADVPFKAWLDGVPITREELSRCRSAHGKADTLTTKPRRLVIKIAASADDFSIQHNLFKVRESRKEAFAPYANDVMDKI